jgi:tetratricopeptide (TPR) repeat protein
MLVAAITLLTISALAWHFRRERPYLIVGWLFYLGTMVPMAGLVQVGGQAIADRYTYLPFLGIFVFAVWGVADLAVALGLHRIALPGISSLAVILLATATWRQEQYWQSNQALWTHTLAASPDNPVAEHNLSIDLMQQGKLQEALPHLQNSVRIDPLDVVSRINLAVDYQNQQRYAEAIEQYEVVLQQTADTKLLPVAYENLGNIYYATGEFAKAERNYQFALRISPGRSSTIAKLRDLRADVEISAFAQSVASHPSAAGYLQLARMMRKAGWIPEARSAYLKALSLDPGLPAAPAELAALPAENVGPAQTSGPEK